jgi:hypothetical protein
MESAEGPGMHSPYTRRLLGALSLLVIPIIKSYHQWRSHTSPGGVRDHVDILK